MAMQSMIRAMELLKISYANSQSSVSGFYTFRSWWFYLNFNVSGNLHTCVKDKITVIVFCGIKQKFAEVVSPSIVILILFTG